MGQTWLIAMDHIQCQALEVTVPTTLSHIGKSYRFSYLSLYHLGTYEMQQKSNFNATKEQAATHHFVLSKIELKTGWKQLPIFELPQQPLIKAFHGLKCTALACSSGVCSPLIQKPIGCWFFWLKIDRENRISAAESVLQLLQRVCNGKPCTPWRLRVSECVCTFSLAECWAGRPNTESFESAPAK